MSNEILALREHLVAENVTCVVMESTGDYWKPSYYLLEDAVNVMLVNPRDARNRPGRKTDVRDAVWLADLGAHGLLRASLVPPPLIRRLRDLTRAHTDLNRDRALGIAALSVIRSKNTYLAAKHRRLCARRGPMKALVAIERAMLVAAHSMLTNGEFFRDLGADYFTTRRPGPVKANAVRQLEALGFTVTLEPLAK